MCMTKYDKVFYRDKPAFVCMQVIYINIRKAKLKYKIAYYINPLRQVTYTLAQNHQVLAFN